MVEASEHMKAESLKDAVLVCRAAAAYSSALKNTSDMLRHSLRLDRLDESDEAELPVLVVKGLTEDDIAQIRASQTPATADVVDVDNEPVDASE